MLPLGKIVTPLAALAMIAMLVFLAWLSADVNSERHYRVAAQLRQLKETDDEWNLQVMRSSLGLNTNYDAISRVLPVVELQVHSIVAGVNEEAASNPLHSALIEDINALVAQESAKGRRIEQFKAQHAIYRNSLRYVPTAAEEIDEKLLHLATSGSHAQANRFATLRDDVANVLRGVLGYSQTLDASATEHEASSMSRIKRDTADLPEDLRAALGVYVNHLDTVISKLGASHQLLGEIENSGTTAAIDKLDDDWTKVQRLAVETQGKSRRWLLAYSAVLILALVYLTWRLVKNYRLLVRAHAQLTQSIRDLKSTQTRLVQSEKMSALGQMVAGIAHEINTPLAYVRGILEYVGERIAALTKAGMLSVKLARYAAADAAGSPATRQLSARALPYFERERSEKAYEDVASFVADGLHGIDQINEIILSLKSFSRADSCFVGGIDLRDNLNSTLVIAKNVLKNKIRVEKQFADIPLISCAPSQLNQVFLNMITNACQAIDGHGTICLATARHDDTHVKVQIIDSGCGIPEHLLSKIFDPFFTTKRVGEGTGLGLAICFRIVEEHGGRILVESTPRQGTKFTIILPMAQPVDGSGESFSADQE